VPFPKSIARINRAITNPVARPLAGRIRPFAVVVHQGRKSGAEFRTPVMVFEDDDGYVVALTYGSEADWVRNVLTSGRAQLVIGGETVPVAEPILLPTALGLAKVAPYTRPVLKALDCTEFLHLRR
jgi:deazaflavin-dependent oxidoreductase (nitroreductase family)